MATYKTIAEIEEKYEFEFNKSYDSDMILAMYNDYIIPVTTNGELLCDIGLFYQCELKKYTAAKKYFQMAIDAGFHDAIHTLAYYFGNIELKYDIMEKLYVISIHEYKYVSSMANLAVYYHNIAKNYDEMKKYYLMAIEYKNQRAMRNFAIYYRDIEKNIPLMLQYFNMAAELKHRPSIIELINYYASINNIPEMLKYHIMLIEDNDISLISDIVPQHISYTELYTKLVNKKCLMSHLQTTKQTSELIKLITLE